MSAESSRAVFLSYASQDAVAAQRICDALRAAGVEVWFDQNELTGGDAWDAKIRKQIAECALFVPIISANTQARGEGYFRIEWRLAAQRTHAMADDKTFLLPVVIDDTRDAEARVPVEFKTVQWTKLPGGEASDKFCARVRRLLGGEIVEGRDAPPRLPSSVGDDERGRLGEKLRRPKKLFPRFAIGALLVAMLGTMVFFGLRRPVVTDRSIAVLPFTNLGADRNDEYLGDGMTEELLNGFAKIPQLKVAARTSSFFFKGKSLPIAEVGRQLGVAYVLEGSVRKTGSQLRITAQLINAADGYHLWSETYDREMTDLLAIETEVSQQVVRALLGRLGIEESRALAKARTENPEAHRLYMLGRYHFTKATEAGWTDALKAFTEAIRLDPGYALAYCGLADNYNFLGGSFMSGQEAWAKGKEAAERAVALAPELADAHLSLALALSAEFDWTGTERELKRALALNPNLALARDQHAWLLTVQGRFDEAIAQSRKAVELDPLSPLISVNLGYWLHCARRFDEADAQLRKTLALEPNLAWAHRTLGWNTLQWKGDMAGALAEMQRAQVLDPDPWSVGSVGYAAARAGDRSKAEGILRDLSQLAKEHYVSPAAPMIVHLGLGEKAKALEWLERCFEQRDPLCFFLKVEPVFDDLRAEPRFQALLRKLGLERPRVAEATMPGRGPASLAAVSSSSQPAAPHSEARQLVEQARALFDSAELQREEFALAEDLLAKAQALDATDGEVWAARAELSRDAIFAGFDLSPARRESLRIQAERAMKLAPDSVDAQLAYGGYLQVLGGSAAAEAVRVLRPLVDRVPDRRRVYRVLGLALAAVGNVDECIQVLERSNALPGGDAGALLVESVACFFFGRYEQSESAVTRSLALQPTGRTRVTDTLLKLTWRGDLDRAAASLAQWPPQSALEPRGAFVASQVWLWRRQPDKAIAALNAFTSDFVSDLMFNGPKSALLALAHEMAGRTDAARAEWENAKGLVTRMLAEDPTRPDLLAWKGVALARLGETAAAAAILRQLEQTGGLRSYFWSCGASSALLRIAVSRGDEVVAKFDREQRQGVVSITNVPAPQASLRLNPVFDPIRATPEFQQWLAAAPAPQPREIPGAAVKPDGKSAPSDKSVAVLAFADLSAAHDSEYFSDGISEELLNVLAKVPGLKVTARTSAFFFKGKNLPIPEIARQLGVAYVIEGSVQRAGDRVKITAQLIKAADGFHVWSETFVRDAKDVFAVEEEIAGLIAKQLSLSLGVSSAAATASVNPEAFELYVQGRQAWNIRTMESFARAEELLNRALALEPNFARAHAALVDVWQIREQGLGRLGPFNARDVADLRRAMDRAQLALKLDPRCAEAHASLGNSYFLSWRVPDAEREFRRAIELNPNYASAHQWLGRLLLADGRMDEALASLRLAAELDPLSSRIADNNAIPSLVAGRAAEALAWVDRALALQPASGQALAQRALALAGLGRRDEAVAAGRRYISEGHELAATTAACALARAGAPAEARRILDKLEPQRQDSTCAGVWLTLSEREKAYAMLETGNVSLYSVESLLFWPEFDPLRDEVRFQNLLAKFGLTEAHARAQSWRAAHPPETPEAKK